MRNRYLTPLRFFATFLLALSGSAAAAAAGVPSPSNSSVPACLVACPAGDVVYRVVVRDLGNFPVVFSTVVIDLSSCPGLALCPTQGPGVSYSPATHQAWMLTDANGVADIRLKLGGVCSAGVRVFADGVMLRNPSVPVASPDQNADLLVSGADALIVNGLLGSHDTGADFDCDGTVTQADFDWMTNEHGGHSCDNAVPALPSSWGKLKLHYR
jgi:hypothetical protein